MYKFCKRLAILGLVFTIIGAIGVGVVAGLGISIGDINYNLYDYLNGYSYNNNYNYTTAVEYVNEVTAEAFAEDYISSSIPDIQFDSIELVFNVGSFRVMLGDEFKVSAYGVDINCLSYGLTDDNLDTMKIVYNPDITGLINYESGSVDITLPDKQYKNLKVIAAGGECYLYDITAEVIDTEASACYLSLNTVSALESCKFDLSVIDASISSCNFKNAEFNVAVGELYSSDLNLIGDTKINVNVGTAYFNLVGHARGDYYVTSKATGGSVNLIGDDDDIGDKSSPYKIDINCDLGSSTIYFI